MKGRHDCFMVRHLKIYDYGGRLHLRTEGRDYIDNRMVVSDMFHNRAFFLMMSNSIRT